MRLITVQCLWDAIAVMSLCRHVRTRLWDVEEVVVTGSEAMKNDHHLNGVVNHLDRDMTFVLYEGP